MLPSDIQQLCADVSHGVGATIEQIFYVIERTARGPPTSPGISWSLLENGQPMFAIVLRIVVCHWLSQTINFRLYVTTNGTAVVNYQWWTDFDWDTASERSNHGTSRGLSVGVTGNYLLSLRCGCGVPYFPDCWLTLYEEGCIGSDSAVSPLCYSKGTRGSTWLLWVGTTEVTDSRYSGVKWCTGLRLFKDD